MTKGNTDLYKLESPKPSKDPQKMKLKKRGGCNLRKSLAWDQAFFTEEGVLDPLELSMLSGYVKPSSHQLSLVHEEEYNNMEITSDSLELQALEENVFKKIAVDALVEEKRTAASALHMHDTSTKNIKSPASLPNQKVLAVQDAKRAGSDRGGYLCPLDSPSLKRPPTTKVASKEPTVSKIPAPKIPTTARVTTVGTRLPQRNQKALPVASASNSTGLKGPLKDFEAVGNNARVSADKSLTDRASTQQARRHEYNSKIQIKETRVVEANTVFEVIQDSLATSTSHKPDNVGGTCKVAPFLPQNACYSGIDIQKGQVQTAKPSGIRMPSPSLGFFSPEMKPPASYIPLQQTSRWRNANESNLPTLTRIGSSRSLNEARTQIAPGKLSDLMNDVLKNGNLKSNHLDVTWKQGFEVINDQDAGSAVQCDSMDCLKVRNCKQLPSHKWVHGPNVEYVESCSTKIESCSEETEIHRDDRKLIVQSAAFDHLKKKNDKKKLPGVCPKVALSSVKKTKGGREPRASNVRSNFSTFPHSASILGVDVEEANDHARFALAFEGSFKEYDACVNESKRYNHQARTAFVKEFDQACMDEKGDHPMEDAQIAVMGILPSQGNLTGENHTKLKHINMLSHKGAPTEITSTLKKSKDEISKLFRSKSEKSCVLNENLISRLQKNSTATIFESNGLSEESLTSISQNKGIPCTKMQRELDQNMNPADTDDTINQSNKLESKRSKPGFLLTKPPQNAVPFSDEWLAALEDAGEEILTLKSGAVQNSPPEKPPHEPGPYSPVKRKSNQAIGPYDCTKYSHLPPSNSQEP